jgi:hypothetical protein
MAPTVLPKPYHAFGGVRNNERVRRDCSEALVRKPSRCQSSEQLDCNDKSYVYPSPPRGNNHLFLSLSAVNYRSLQWDHGKRHKKQWVFPTEGKEKWSYVL